MDRLEKSFQAVRLLENIVASAQIDPRKELQKTGRRVIAAGHEHRITGNPSSRVCRTRAASRSYCWVLPNPWRPTRMTTASEWPIASSSAGIQRSPGLEFALVKKGVETLGAQPAIQLCRRRSVATGVARKKRRS